MTKKEVGLANFKRELQKLAAETEIVIGQVSDASQVVKLDQNSVGRLSRVDALQAQAMAKASVSRQKNQLIKIHNAINRIDAGQFGYCCECDRLIAPARLELNPMIQTCIHCAHELELFNK